MKQVINFTLNNEKRSVEVETGDILLNVLRDKIGIKSPKCGCDRGDCGACTILINGKSVRSCLVLAVEADDQDIITLEGLKGKEIERLKKKFLKFNSFQCGFCSPGVIISAVELLKKNPRPDAEEVKEALAGNLCRCTGYTSIIRAITDPS
ncbi:MAG: (2Fe-2S)-binding protein [Spirochaetes bacterium]|nr:(2Fe-2S)-binding protein [Spirochaetota bacterium]